MILTFTLYILAAWGFISLLGLVWHLIDRRLEEHIERALEDDQLAAIRRMYDGEGD